MTHPRLLDRPSARRSLLVLGVLLLLACGWVLGAAPEAAQARDVQPAQETGWTGRWSDDVLDLAARVPLQSQGRVKPLSTWASFALLGMNKRHSCKDAADHSVSAMEWCLDAIFRPRLARTYRCFLIETDEVLDDLGLSEGLRERFAAQTPKREFKKRDRYSYDDLVPDAAARERINAKAREFHGLEQKERSRAQEGVVELESALSLFEDLMRLVDFARWRVPSKPLAGVPVELRGGTFCDLLEKAPELAESIQKELAAAGGAHAGGHGDTTPKISPEAQAISDLLESAFATTEHSLAAGLFPPAGSVESDPQWYAVRDVAAFAMMRSTLDPRHAEALRELEGMADSVGDDGGFTQHLQAYHALVQKAAERRGEYGKIEQEVAFYRLDPFGKSMVFYLVAFALLAISWLGRGRLRWLELGAWALVWLVLGLHVYGIVQRCLIRERPPIKTLYETVVFISGAGVLFLLLIEHMSHRRVALALAPIVGYLGLMIASGYEALEGRDTMQPLVAVLDTNFWLATHVTCISIGYCAGLLASLIAHVYVLGKVFRFRAQDQAFYRSVGKMVYGTVCFALLFSLVGTILGGIWANESWGRFWGWDPKENGALLICLSQLAILHGRMGGLFKTFGVCQAAIFGGIVVAFSWWGVNLLNVGLHSYGFTAGVSRALNTFYGVEAAVMGAGLYGWLRDRASHRVAAST